MQDGVDICVHYGMDPDQSQAYQLCLVWVELSKKLFPDYKHYSMPKKGDPRKAMLFKYTYKLVRETRGLIPYEQYPLYVRAQLEILKAITDGRQHAQVDPNVLVGDKAWVRWRIWKKKYDQRMKVGDAPTRRDAGTDQKIRAALNETKVHLVKHFQGLPTFEQMKQADENKNLFRWIAGKKISPFYLVLSPFIEKLYPGCEGLATNVDLDVFREQTDVSTLEIFAEIFPNE